uniref:Putative vacuolar sorting protein/ubiquitin receptor vps23 n=1 Tax=Phlebotomus kandelakii TaxID=1109342 RepID=A0A6B2EJS6_9DIPT
MASPEEVRQVLVKAKYRNIDAAKKDVMQVLRQYHGLTFLVEDYVFNDGTCKELFRLQGTIPVNYKQSVYHIPICIILMDTHPHNAPMCYVKPTPEMHIKVSQYVDHNGKVYLPYLHDWQPASSDIEGLIQVMIVIFGQFMPVYSKPKANTAPYPSNFNMPQATNMGGSAYPPYPTSGYPPYPGAGGTSNFVPYPPVTGAPNSAPYPMDMPVPNAYPSPYANNSTGQGTITDEHIRASLLSAVEEKMWRRIVERVNQRQAELDTLKRTKQELQEGRSKIEGIVAALEKEEADLKRHMSVLSDKKEELDKSLEAFERKDGIDVDEAVSTTAPLYRQLLNVYADEAATEDAIYYLGEGLRNGVIDLEVFLKHVRQLSRKQFVLRILMQKCRQKAGLAG